MSKRYSLSSVGCLIVIWFYFLVLVAVLSLRPFLGETSWWLALLDAFAPYLFVPLFPAALGILYTGSRLARIGWLVVFAIFVVWFGPIFLPKAASVTANARPQVRIMTLNTYVDSLRADPLMASIAAESPDVVALQELNPLNAEALAGWKGSYPFQALLPLHGGEGGLGLLSKFPIQDHSWLALADQQTDAQWVTMEIEGRGIELVNVHLISNRLDVSTDESRAKFDNANRTREQQARDLSAFVSGHPKSIIAGDLNATDTTMTYEILKSQLKDSYREMGSGMGATFSSEWFWFGRIPIPPRVLRLDYILHSNSIVTLEAHIGEKDSQSDHLPVASTLVVK